jgi:hypothetical protein
MRAFTIKSRFFGVLGLLIISIFPTYADVVLHLGYSIKGYLPVIPLFLTVLLSFGWNRLAGKVNKNLALSAGELAVIFSIMAVVCWLPGVQKDMVRQMVLPRYEELTTNANWKEAGVTTRLPDRLFPAGADGELIGETTHFGMIQGGMKVADVPFGQWVGPLLNWMPFLLLLFLCLLALTFLVHRQWTKHEQLRYPIATVIDSLIKQDPNKPGGSIFRQKMFWVGFGIIFGINVIRYLHAWFPNNLPKIPTEYILGWYRLFPIIGESNANMFSLHWMPISFALIGISYFVATDVSLSIGIMAPLATIIGVQYYLITGVPVSSTGLSSFRAGGFIAVGLILLYTGRTYYFPILRKALFLGRGKSSVDAGGVLAARVFLAAYVFLILITSLMGVDLFIAWVFVTFLLLLFLVLTRLVCETGVPIMVAGWSIPTVLTGLLGPGTIGAAPVMFMLFLNSIMTTSGTTTLMMPYMATSLKVLDDNKVNLRRFAFVAKISIVISLVVGFVSVLILAYTQGAGNLLKGERAVWTEGVRQVLTMIDFGTYAASESASGVAKLGLLQPDGSVVGFLFTGLAVVIGCYLLRFRFSWWPLHPLFFIVIGTSVGSSAWASFLLGWVIKTLIVKVGGGRVYHSVKPLFVAFIIGEFMIITTVLIVGFIFNLITGNDPVNFWMI